MYESKTVAQIYALTLGLALLIIGVAGFVVVAFTHSIIAPWTSGVYALAGLLGLATWRRADSARVYVIVVGMLYLLLGAWGFVAFLVPIEHPSFGLIQSPLAAAIFHVVVGLASFTIGFTSPRHGRYPLPDIAELA